MKRLSLVILLSVVVVLLAMPVKAQGQFPSRPNGWVYDGIGALSAQQIDQINTDGKKLQGQTGISLVLAAVNDCGQNPQQFGTDLFNYWGIGNAQTNRGYLILMCWNGGVKGPGRTVVSVPGAGLEAAWPKEVRSQIVGLYIKPALSQDKSPDQIKSDGDLGVALVATYEEYVKRMMPVAQPVQPQPVQPIQPQPIVPVRSDPPGTWSILGVNNPILVWIVIFITLAVLLWIIAVLVRRWWRNQQVYDDSTSNYSGPSSYDGSPSYGGPSSYDSGPSYPRHHVHDYGGSTTVVNNNNGSGSGDFLTGMIVGENLAGGGHHHHDDDDRRPDPAPYTPPSEPVHHDDSSPFGGGHASSSDNNDSSPFGGGSTGGLFGGDSSPFGGGSTDSGGGSSSGGGSAGGASSDNV